MLLELFRARSLEECPIHNSSKKLALMQNQSEMYVDKYGRFFPVILSQMPLKKEDESLGAVVEFRDVTLEKKAEKERLAALELTKEQERRHARKAEEHRQNQEEFVNTLCHEMRTPLNAIVGATDLAEDDFSELESLLKTEAYKLYPDLFSKFSQPVTKLKENLAIISQCSIQLRRLVNDVLDLSKLEQTEVELNPVIFNLKEQIQLIVRMFSPQIAEKNLSIKIKAEKTWVKTDLYRFTQIMTNLISNAVKFTERGEIEIITCAGNEENLDIKKNIYLAVIDTGIGMEEHEVLRIFNRFKQANSQTGAQYGGSGLGLVIVKKLVEAMGEKIRVKSKKGEGTRFDFSVQSFPMTSEDQLQIEEQAQKNKMEEHASSQSKSNNVSSVVNTGKRILVVEDNETNQKILTNLLNKKGHLCEIAENGKVALEKYGQLSFDLIFWILKCQS